MDRSMPPCSSPDCSFNDASIACKGSCRQRFHAVCVGLSVATVPVVASSSRFFWFCDVCRDHLRTGRTTLAVWSAEGSSSGGEQTCGSTSCSFTDQLVTCDGPCGKDFHGMCVKLSKSDLSVIGSSSNIVWFCAECKLNVIAGLDGSEELPKPSEHFKNPPDSLPNPEGIGSEHIADVKDEDRGNDRKTPDSSSSSEESYKDPSMTFMESPESGELTDSENDAEASDDSLGISNDEPSATQLNISVPAGVQSNSSIFLASAKTESTSSSGTADLTSTPEIKPKKDENNNSSPPRKRPLDTDATIAAVAPKTVKKDSSVFSLYLRFSIPNMLEQCAENAVRKALGMSHSDPVMAWNVVPYRVLFPVFSTFRVDMDARWKSAALKSSTWRNTANYSDHRAWTTVKLRD